jgi:hypothetical protein
MQKLSAAAAIAAAEKNCQKNGEILKINFYLSIKQKNLKSFFWNLNF